jgi:hypothetical protein
MLIKESLPDVLEYVNKLDSFDSNAIQLSKLQKNFLAFCMTAMLVLGSFCWTRMERATFKTVGARALGWMLHHSKIPWQKLWETSVILAINIAGLIGIIVIDDSERLRAKCSFILHALSKVKDKKTGGFSMAQNIVFIVFVTKYLTIPVGFRFFRPDPDWKSWRENDIKLRAQKIKKSLRPKKPIRNPDYPMRSTIAVQLIEEFKKLIPNVQVTALTADAAYLTSELMNGFKKCFPSAQFISQITKKNLVADAKLMKTGNTVSVEEYFKNKVPIETEVIFRGKNPKRIKMLSARLYVQSKATKFHIIALKYDEETEYRYLAATKLSWRAIDIVRAYAMRWLVEVVIEDWKVYSGWGKMAFQRGEDGACRGVILSLLVDHFLSTHPLQMKQLNENKPLWTSGSLCRFFQCRVILSGIEAILKTPDPTKELKTLFDDIEKVVDFRLSDKHMSGRDIGDFEESPNLMLRYKHAS